jgi:hypothetical protein
MENLLFLIATLAIRISSKSLKKRTIGDTGCSVMLDANAAITYTEFDNGDHLYMSSFNTDSVTYGFVLMDLKNKLNNPEEAEYLLGDLMLDLKKASDIQHSFGLDRGLKHPVTECVSGIIDYWQDKDGIDWKIKGWTNGNCMAVMYVKNINHASVKKQDFFLDCIRF